MDTPKTSRSQPPAKQKKKRVLKSTKAGLRFPVTRLRNQMKAGRLAKIIGTGSAVYMAAVLEYVTGEMLTLARDIATQNKRGRIKPRDITLAVKRDPELDELLKDVTIAEGGVAPFIYQELLRTRTQ